MNLLQFPQRLVPPRPEGTVKYGVYPLGSEDVVMSTATFQTLLYALTDAVTGEDRAALGDVVLRMYQSTWVSR